MPPVFGLVHGGQQGAWAYDFLVRELRARGYDAIAPELPNWDANAGATEYANVVCRALEDAGHDVILVGHSLGGLTIPLVPDQRPVSRLVFLCGAYPEIGRSHLQVRSEEAGEGVSAGPASAWEQPGDFHMLPADLARELFFHDCPPDVREWAVANMRPQARKPLREITPLTAWPPTPRTLIIAADDRCIPRASAIRTAQRLFGETPLELPGGHCPSLARPAQLADLLLRLVAS